ncbi:vegetative cell wall protein gp1 [Zea mays]|nr:vegetative cell wall protein gp1 [Zea mays]|eukprot:XP_020398295.1 vegetative cell wall protein gp1 [Zea mays]
MAPRPAPPLGQPGRGGPSPCPFFLAHAASPSSASPSRSSRRHLLPWIPHASNREHDSFPPWPDRPPPAAGRQQLDIFNLSRELPPRLLPAQLGALAAGEQQLPGSMAPVKLEQPSSQLWRPLPAGMQFPWPTPSGAAMAELPGSTPVPLLSPWPPAAMAASPRRARVLLPGRPAPCPRRPGIPTASSPFPKLLLPWPILPCAQLLLAMCPTPLAA